jgi:hypothetical protein
MEETTFTLNTGVLNLGVSTPFGQLGLLVTFLIVMMGGLAGMWNPIVGITFVGVGLVIGAVTNLSVLSITSVFGAFIIIGIIAIAARRA